MNVVVPIAGRGYRFATAGYEPPKPFVLVRGVPMVEYVLRNLSLPDEANLILVALNEWKDRYESQLRNICERSVENWEILWLHEVTQGAACTVLMAQHLIDDDELVIANCDQVVLDHDYMRRSLHHYRRQKANGGILCCYQTDCKWSYVSLNRDGTVAHVAEKQVISPFATVGIYWYARGRDFVTNAQEMIDANDRVKGEFYVAPVYNRMIAKGAEIVPFLVNGMYGLGTPEDLKTYERA